jgi:hypothetical protein
MAVVSAAPLASITGDVIVTRSDVARALANLPLFRRRWLYLAMAAMLAGALLAFGRAPLSAVAPFLGFTALFEAFLFIWPRWIARRTVAAMPDRTVRYRADDSELTIATTGGTVTRSWNRITEFREEPDAFLIWTGPRAVQMIPKRAFSREQVAWLRATLRRQSRASGQSSKRGLGLVSLWLVLGLMFLIFWLFLDTSAGKR